MKNPLYVLLIGVLFTLGVVFIAKTDDLTEVEGDVQGVFFCVSNYQASLVAPTNYVPADAPLVTNLFATVEILPTNQWRLKFVRSNSWVRWMTPSTPTNWDTGWIPTNNP